MWREKIGKMRELRKFAICMLGGTLISCFIYFFALFSYSSLWMVYELEMKCNEKYKLLNFILFYFFLMLRSFPSNVNFICNNKQQQQHTHTNLLKICIHTQFTLN